MKKMLNGTPVEVVEAADGKLWVRAYELITAMGLNLTKQQVDTKLAGTMMAAQIGSPCATRWYVTYPRGVRMLVNKCRPYTDEGKIWKFSLAVMDLRDLNDIPKRRTTEGTSSPTREQMLAELMARTAPTPPPAPVVTQMPNEAATVIQVLQEQLLAEKARNRQLTDALTETAGQRDISKPLVATPPVTRRDELRQLIMSYVNKLIMCYGWARDDRRARDLYETVWANLYSEFALRTHANYRARYHNMSDEDRKKAGVSCALDLIEQAGRLEEFYALAYELCPVGRFRTPYRSLHPMLRNTLYDGGASTRREPDAKGETVQAVF